MNENRFTRAVTFAVIGSVLTLLVFGVTVLYVQHVNAGAPLQKAALNLKVYLPLIEKNAGSSTNPTPAPGKSPTTVSPSPTVPAGTPTMPPPSPTPSASSQDWSMLAANPQRTSWVSEEVRGDLQVQWYHPIEPYIPEKVQPIAANGKIYVATARGLYAFNASDGSQAWIYATELPLGHSPTIATVNGKSIAYVGGYDHKLHAIDANSGAVAPGYTPYDAGAGFDTNPLVIQDSYTRNHPVILAGNRDGKFYAFDAVSGASLWAFQTGGPISQSAAYKNGVIYFASEDMSAYALNVSDGSQLWKSAKLGGAGFTSSWPVVYTEKATHKDYVVFTGAENYRSSEELNLVDLDQMYFVPGCRSVSGFTCPSELLYSGSTAPSNDPYWTPGTSLLDVSKFNPNYSRGSIATYFEANPQRHMVFALDSRTGQEYSFDSNGNGKPEYPPFTFSGVTAAGNKYPPVINGIDNILYAHDFYSGAGSWIGRGDVVGWKWGTNIISRVSPVTHAEDEPMAFSSGGKLVYWALCCDREGGAFDVTIPYGQPNRSWLYFGYNLNSLAPDYQPMFNDGDSNLYGDMNGWQVYSGKSQSKNGVYGKHETAQSPPIPYRGKVYLIKGNTLFAFSPNAGSPAKLGLATIVSAASSSGTPSRAQLTQRLESEVQKMLAAGHLRPGYHSGGGIDNLRIYDSQGGPGDLIFDYFQNPADTIYTLLLAYPYLSSGTQTQVRDYLRSNYGPGAKYDVTKIVHVGWGSGTPRESFTLPPEEWTSSYGFGAPYYSPLDPQMSPWCGSCGWWHTFPPFNFYAAWKYAQIVGNGDAALAKSMFNAMSGKMEAPPADSYLITKPYFINLYAAGYLGYLNLKQMAGLGSDSTVQGYYQHMLQLRVTNFAGTFKDTPFWGPAGYHLGVLNYSRSLSVARNFMFLTPEIAAYMNQNVPASDLRTTIGEYLYVAPYWFVSRFDGTYGEGTYAQLYDTPALFQAKAWVLQQPYGELVKWLDVPAFDKGDLFYIQNLAATLAAGN